MSAESAKPLKKKVLGVFTLTMINVAAIQSLRNLPLMASVGAASLFFYLVAAIGFFIPCALVSAELATGWPSRGGIYTWVKEAFGSKWGFFAIWMQWTANVIWYPTILSFAAATLAYLFNPALAENRLYVLFIILLFYWVSTVFDAFGMKASGFISSFGAIVGTLLPTFFIIFLGFWWIISGNPSETPLTPQAMIPDLSSLGNIVFLVGVMLGFSGIEMSAVHANEVKNPQKNYPKAILLSVLIILTTSVLSSLAVAFVVPNDSLSLVAGVMQAFSTFFSSYQITFITPVIALLIVIGSVATVATWIVGPSKGLYQTSEEGHLPLFFHKTNKSGMPIRIMLLQGTLVTILSSVFLLLPDVNLAFWILNDLTALLSLIMYMLIFGAAIRLRYSQPAVKRAYRIPGGPFAGMWAAALVGILACLFAFFIGFIPPTQLKDSTAVNFPLTLGIALAALCAIPWLITALEKYYPKSH